MQFCDSFCTHRRNMVFSRMFTISGLISIATTSTHRSTNTSPNSESSVNGALEHVSLAWVEGWSCISTNPTRNVSVELYAEGVQGDSYCRQYNGITLCRCGQGIAMHLRELGVAKQCGGSAWKGFHIQTPKILVDGVTRNIYVFPVNSTIPLGSAYSFDSDVVYKQEPFGEGSVDFHLLVNEKFGKGEIPESAAKFYGSDHTLFVFWPPKTNTTEVISIDYDDTSSTGVNVPSPRNISQRHVGDASCYEADGTVRCNSVSVTQSAVGFVVDTRALGYYGGFVGMQHGWTVPPQPWMRGSHDTFRVSFTVTQPLVFNDDVTTSPDNIAYWYHVLYLNDRSQPTSRPRGVWFTQQAFQSRSTGLQTASCTHCTDNTPCAAAGGRCNMTRQSCEYPCGNTSTTNKYWCAAVPDARCFQYRLLHPLEPQIWVDTKAATSYIQVPLISSTPFLTLCGNGSYREGNSSNRQAANWTGPGTNAFCFSVSSSQLEDAIHLLNSVALKQDRGSGCNSSDTSGLSVDCPVGRHCVEGECRVFGQLSTSATDFELQFMLINAEAVGPGRDKDGQPNNARIGLSVKDYMAEIMHES
eukprot:m.81061 g.81061  ORF g.81061 m.81061 type:complete len:584 (-) comp25380_c0_seq1:333-2084(-)